MYYSLGIICALISIISSDAAAINHANITPFSIVYTVYPLYNSDLWVEVWQDQSQGIVRLSDDIIECKPGCNQRTVLSAPKETLNKPNSAEDSQKSEVKENKQLSSNQPTQIRALPLNYKNWPTNLRKPES